VERADLPPAVKGGGFEAAKKSEVLTAKNGGSDGIKKIRGCLSVREKADLFFDLVGSVVEEKKKKGGNPSSSRGEAARQHH